MQGRMLSLDRFLRRRRRAVLAAWAVVFIAEKEKRKLEEKDGKGERRINGEKEKTK